MGKIYSTRLLLALLIFAWVGSTPIVANAKTMICSKFKYFNAQSLENFRSRQTGEISDWIEGIDIPSDWVEGSGIPDDVDRIIIALPKSEALEKFGCVDQAEILVPGVKDAILFAMARVGSIPQNYKEILGPSVDKNPFGPTSYASNYVRTSSVEVQVSITMLEEPYRSIFALEVYFDLPFYCEEHDNCGIQVGDD